MPSQKLQQTIQHYLFLSLCFVIPLHKRFAVGIIALLLINSIVGWVLDSKSLKKIFRPLPLLFISVYGLYIWGFSTSMHHDKIWLDLEHKLSLLLFPIILFTSCISKVQIQQFLKTFVWGALASCLICFAVASYNYFIEWDSGVFFYKKLSSAVGLHASYMSLFNSFAIFIVLFQMKTSALRFSFDKKDLFPYLQIILLFSFTLFLSSRTATFTFWIIFASYLFAMYYQKRLFLGLRLMSFTMLGLSGILLASPNLNARYQKGVKSMVLKKEQVKKRDIRPRLWDLTTSLIMQQPIFGYGNGDAQIHLNHKFEKEKHLKWKEINLNPHNQYLQLFLAFGIVGLLLFLASLLIPLSLAWQEDHYLYIIFITLFALSIMTESMLETQSGVVFYAFFNSLLAKRLIEDNPTLSE